MPNTLVLLSIITVTILITGTAGYILPTSFAGVPPPDSCQGKCEATLAKKLVECEGKEDRCLDKQDKKNAKCIAKCGDDPDEVCLNKCAVKDAENMTKCEGEGEISKCQAKAIAKFGKCDGKCDPPLDVRKEIDCGCEGGLTLVPCTDDTPELMGLACEKNPVDTDAIDKFDELCNVLCQSQQVPKLGSYIVGSCHATDVCGA